MKLLLVVGLLSMLYGANANSSSGCDADVIKRFESKLLLEITAIGPVECYWGISKPQAEGIDSITNSVQGPVYNNTLKTELITCNKGKIVKTYQLTYKTVDSNSKDVLLTGYQDEYSTYKAWGVTCAKGQTLGYICDPKKANSGIFTLTSKTDAPVPECDMKACRDLLQEVSPGTELAMLTMDGCKKPAKTVV